MLTITCALSEARQPENGPLVTDETFGPFEYVQITYEGIHAFGEGERTETVFYIDGGSGMWYPEKRTPHDPTKPDGWNSCGPDLAHHGWTDLCISEQKG